MPGLDEAELVLRLGSLADAEQLAVARAAVARMTELLDDVHGTSRNLRCEPQNVYGHLLHRIGQPVDRDLESCRWNARWERRCSRWWRSPPRCAACCESRCRITTSAPGGDGAEGDHRVFQKTGRRRRECADGAARHPCRAETRVERTIDVLTAREFESQRMTHDTRHFGDVRAVYHYTSPPLELSPLVVRVGVCVGQAPASKRPDAHEGRSAPPASPGSNDTRNGRFVANAVTWVCPQV